MCVCVCVCVCVFFAVHSAAAGLARLGAGLIVKRAAGGPRPGELGGVLPENVAFQRLEPGQWIAVISLVRWGLGALARRPSEPQYAFVRPADEPIAYEVLRRFVAHTP